MATYGTKGTVAPAGAIVLHPGDNISSIVSAAPAGATFYFEAGVYRDVALSPKSHQTFIGAKGAVINGSALITDFTKSGSQWVISGQTQEGPRIFADHGDGSSMRPGYPETVFVNDKPLRPVDALSKLASGTFYFDYASDKIYIHDNPVGKKVEVGKLKSAFSGFADDVTIRNFVVEKYNSPVQVGAIHGRENWTIRDNEVRLNYGVGIKSNDNSDIVGNYVHDNGEMGLGGSGKNILVKGNEIARNGAWSGIYVLFEGGGAKFSETDHLVVRGNYSHDNHGYGFWTDIDNIHTLYEKNVFEDNSHGGISHEISYDAVIRNNSFSGNGYDFRVWMWGGQIQVQNSRNVDVYGNKVEMIGANGVGLIQQDRGSGAYGAHVTTGNHIHDNVFVSQDSVSKVGGAADFNGQGMVSGGNTWSNNYYFMPDTNVFQWGGNLFNFDAFKLATGETGIISQRPAPASGIGSDSVAGDAKDNWLFGFAGDDVLSGLGGRDLLDGGEGKDQLIGGTGNDTLKGSSGGDVLVGGAGRDVMYGGDGSDRFDFDLASETGRTSTSCDLIRDFQHLVDDVDLRSIDASTVIDGNNTFLWRGAHPFTTSASGEVRYKQFDNAGSANDFTMVYVDTDKDTGSEFQIKLAGLVALGPSDFLL